MIYPMFEPLLDAVMVIGPMKEVYYCNDACAALFDLPRKKMTSGIPSYDLITLDNPELFIMKDGSKGETQETGYIEVNFESKSGKKGLVQVAILPTQELFGRNKLWFVYFHDVSLEARLHRKYVKQVQANQQSLAAPFGKSNDQPWPQGQSERKSEEALDPAPLSAGDPSRPEGGGHPPLDDTKSSHFIQSTMNNVTQDLKQVMQSLTLGFEKGELNADQVKNSLVVMNRCIELIENTFSKSK